MIHVIATIELAPGTREAFLAEFRKIVAEVRAEEGCLDFGPAIDIETGLSAQVLTGADRVTIVEQWTTLDALRAHLVAPHMQAYRPKVKDYVRKTELRVLQPA